MLREILIQPSRRDLIKYGIGAAALAKMSHAQTLGGSAKIGGAAKLARAAGSSDITFITGQTVGTPTNTFDGNIGFIFTVGAAPITVTQIARWVIAGNALTHELSIKTAAGAAITNGQVTVNTSGATTGAYLWGTLATPIVLSASTVYFCFTMEASGGDEWGNSDGTATHNATDAAKGDAYYQAGGAGAPTANLADPAIYGPVNFRYHL